MPPAAEDTPGMWRHRPVISLEHIAEASRTSVRLDNGVTLPVSELYRSAFAAYLSRSRS